MVERNKNLGLSNEIGSKTYQIQSKIIKFDGLGWRCIGKVNILNEIRV